MSSVFLWKMRVKRTLNIDSQGVRIYACYCINEKCSIRCCGVVMFCSTAMADTVPVIVHGEQYYLQEETPAASQQAAAFPTCITKLETTISPLSQTGNSISYYSFNQKCADKYASISLTQLSSGSGLNVGLQEKNSSGAWLVVLPPSGLSISVPLTVGSYRWVIANTSSGTHRYNGKYSYIAY